jgi:YVTN family beta-propeller protein
MQAALMKWGPLSGKFLSDQTLTAGCFDGHAVWLTSAKNNTVTKLRFSDGAVFGVYPTGNAPGACVYDGQYIWVVNTADNTVSKIRADGGETVAVIGVGKGPMALAFEGWRQQLYVVNQLDNSVSVLNIAGDVVATIPVGDMPSGVAADGLGRVWVVNTKDGTVSCVVDKALVTTSNVKTPLPTDIRYTGQDLWVANSGDSSISRLVIDNTGNVVSVADTVGVGQKPAALAFDGSNILSADSGGNSVTLVDVKTKKSAGVYRGIPNPAALVVDAAGSAWIVSKDGGVYKR